MSEHTNPSSYYAVIFTSRRTPGDHGYDEMSARMVELAAQQPGFLGMDSVRNAEGVGITVSYWRDLDSITAWRNHAEHRVAQARGRDGWYDDYTVRICRVDREYSLRAAERTESATVEPASRR